MGQYPVLGTSIVDAMKNPKISFKTNILIGGSTFRHGNRVIQYAGGFTTVFPFTTKRRKKIAVRCWRADIGDAKKRTQAITTYLANLNSPYFVDFKYVDDALLINEFLYPIVTMDWVEGVEFADYVYNKKDESDVIKNLADNFLKMVQYLHQEQIAHGDLQHGNILVKLDGNLVLVDYDSMAVPTLNNMKDVINGLPNYQHPNRERNKFLNPTLDYFSELVIYLSLLIFAEDDANFSHIKNDWNPGHQNILFSKEDFLAPEDSEIIRIARNSTNETIRQLTYHLCQALQETDISNLKPLESLIPDLIVPFDIENIIDKWGTPEITKTIEEKEEEIQLDNTEIMDKWDTYENEPTIKDEMRNIDYDEVTNKF
jgi:serine/threonine protein kinase